MKVLIDMPDEDVENVKYCYQAIFGDMYFKMMRAIRDGIRIPGNATNGDVVKIMFPNAGVEESTFLVFMSAQNFNMSLIDKDWWDAPYKMKSEE